MKTKQLNLWAIASLLTGVVAVILIFVPGRLDLVNPALIACGGALILGIIAIVQGNKIRVGAKPKLTWLAYIGIALPIVALVVLMMLMETVTKMP